MWTRAFDGHLMTGIKKSYLGIAGLLAYCLIWLHRPSWGINLKLRLFHNQILKKIHVALSGKTLIYRVWCGAKLKKKEQFISQIIFNWQKSESGTALQDICGHLNHETMRVLHSPRPVCCVFITILLPKTWQGNIRNQNYSHHTILLHLKTQRLVSPSSVIVAHA